MAELEVHEVFGGQEFIDKLIDELDAAFPQVNPTPNLSLATVMYKAGQKALLNM
tara:strand:- start:213 stop:374 length:162 start_codon:yes stop_codon:yes gene_type:complete